MAVVAGEALVGEAELGQGERGLADRVGAVGVAPDAVVLVEGRLVFVIDKRRNNNKEWRTAGRQKEEKSSGNKPETTHQLPTTNDSHDAQGLHAVLLRIEGRVVVAEDDVRVHVGVEVVDAVLVGDDPLEGRLRLAGRVVGAVARTQVRAVAVDVHVGVLPAVGGRVQVDGVGRDVGAVREAVVRAVYARREAAQELVRACS